MPVSSDLGFRHVHEPGTAPALLLLHGTGGDETDLVPLARHVAPASAILSPRGNVTENGMPRFFRRFAEGVFDLEDVARRADELAAFIGDAAAAYGLRRPVAIGFSNGANIAAAMMLRHPHILAAAALIRAQPTLVPEALPDLGGLPVLMLAGERDPIVSAYDSSGLAATLEAAGAEVLLETLPAGHSLTQLDVGLLKDWLARLTLV